MKGEVGTEREGEGEEGSEREGDVR